MFESESIVQGFSLVVGEKQNGFQVTFSFTYPQTVPYCKCPFRDFV